MLLFEAITDFKFSFSWSHYKLNILFLLDGFYFLLQYWTCHSSDSTLSVQALKDQRVSGWWEKLSSNPGITNWKDVTVFYPFVEHSKVQHPHIILGYPVLPAFLFLCFMCNTQKMTKCQTSALGNAFITYLCYFFVLFCFLFSAFFLPLGDSIFWPLVIFAPLLLILHMKKFLNVTAKVTLNHSGFLYLVHAS